MVSILKNNALSEGMSSFNPLESLQYTKYLLQSASPFSRIYSLPSASYVYTLLIVTICSPLSWFTTSLYAIILFSSSYAKQHSLSWPEPLWFCITVRFKRFPASSYSNTCVPSKQFSFIRDLYAHIFCLLLSWKTSMIWISSYFLFSIFSPSSVWVI